MIDKHDFACLQINCGWATEKEYYTEGQLTYTEAKKRGWTWAWRPRGDRFWRDDYCPDCSKER